MVAAFSAGLHCGPGVFGACTGKDNDVVFAITANIQKGSFEVFVCLFVPAQRTTIGMEPHFKYPVLTAHANRVIFIRVVIEDSHRLVQLSRVNSG